MKKYGFTLSLLILSLFLAACAGGESATANTLNSAGSENGESQISQSNGTGAGEQGIRLSENFSGALTVPAQLALGTVQLEDTDLAVGETQAAELLPLWQAYQSLSLSDNTADVELQAIINSLQNEMDAAQLAAIADMALTEEKMTEMLESGDLGFGAGGPGFGGDFGEGEGGGGGFPGGGPPDGGLPGGGPPGGGFPGGGPGGFGGGDLSEDDLATRRAEFADGAGAQFQDRILIGLVTRLLEGKMGITPEGPQRGQAMNEAFSAVAESAGITVEELQAQLAEDQTMAELLQESNADMDALRAELIEIFGGFPGMEDSDIEQSVADWLGIE